MCVNYRVLFIHKYLTQSISSLAQLACEWLYRVSSVFTYIHMQFDLHSTIRKDEEQTSLDHLRVEVGGVYTVAHGFSLWLGPQLATQGLSKARVEPSTWIPPQGLIIGNQHPFNSTGLVLGSQCSRYWNTICPCICIAWNVKEPLQVW